jgi:hypothetical protein
VSLRSARAGSALGIARIGIPSEGAAGRIVAVTVNTLGSDEHSLFRGSVVVDQIGDGLQEYKWGGTTCPAKHLQPDQVANLQRALSDPRMSILPLFKNHQGGNVCLVAFTLVNRSFLDEVAP